jgi:hypothetical protein
MRIGSAISGRRSSDRVPRRITVGIAVPLACHPQMVSLDLNGKPALVDDAALASAPDAAAAFATKSTQLRDLALLLDRALNGHRVVLRCGELQLLRRLAAESGLSDLA